MYGGVPPEISTIAEPKPPLHNASNVSADATNSSGSLIVNCNEVSQSLASKTIVS